jgi:protein gp37
MKNTKIEWAHHTVNFWWGCAKVSLACMFCYAEMLAKLFSRGKATWGPTGARWDRSEQAMKELAARDRSAGERGVRERVFINSMSDTFEDRADMAEARRRLWMMCYCVEHLDILLLTKRPENVVRMVPKSWIEEWPGHVWIGTTVENQEMADQRIPLLLEVPAPVHFLSCEPLLGPLDLHPLPPGAVRRLPVSWLEAGCADTRIDWVIAGGESGGHARPMMAQWARSLRDQCRAAGVPFFFKQWGEWLPFDQCGAAGVKMPMEDALNHAHTGAPYRAGKKKSGRLLDGVEHGAVPVDA